MGERLSAGADAVVCGTRFLLSDESAAHPRYKEALLGAEETIVTGLFGLGWPAPVPASPPGEFAPGDRGAEPRLSACETPAPLRSS